MMQSIQAAFSRQHMLQRALWRLPLMVVLAALALTGALFGIISPAKATSLPSDFVETPYVSGITGATTMRFAPDGRLFIAQQNGTLRVVDNDVLVETPVISLTVNSLGERGLLGIAFDPDFPTDPYLYLYYTVPEPLHNRVSRFTLAGNTADPQSEVILIDLDPLSATNHNGGALNFGSDGKLYISVGENAVPSNAQSLDNLLGKILRINKDGSIPTDNPFYGTATGNNRAIWSRGLRNPFTFAVQPGTGLMYINDVGSGGASAREEVNPGMAGVNYGWPIVEGDANDPEFTNPLYNYPHVTECSIVGAAFYNPDTVTFPNGYVGDYFFADLCGQWIRRMDTSTHNVVEFATDIAAQPVDIRVSPDGELYYLSRGDGTVYRISYQPPAATNTPTATSTPDPNATPTETPVPSSNLVINGGFETAADGDTTVPKFWKTGNLTRDKRKCNTNEKTVAHSGDCAFVFKGVPGENARLQQILESSNLNSGDTLTAHAFVWTKNLTLNVSAITAVIKYPTAEKDKITLPIDQEYTSYTELLDSVTLVEAPAKIKLRIHSKSDTGKLWIDDVALNVNEARRFGLLPLPGNS